MTDSLYKTLAGVLEADLADQEQVFFNHASRYRCRDEECETKRELRTVRDSIRDRLARLGIRRPRPTVTFVPLPPHLQGS